MILYRYGHQILLNLNLVFIGLYKGIRKNSSTIILVLHLLAFTSQNHI